MAKRTREAPGEDIVCLETLAAEIINGQPLKPKKPLGRYGKLQRIQPRALFLDTYQRYCSPRAIRELAERFRYEAAGAILVSRRQDGRYYIIDGQRRALAYVMLGLGEIVCYVVALTREEEAMIFFETNTNSRSLVGAAKFNALVEGQDEVAVNLLATLERYGIRAIARQKADSYALGAIMTVYKWAERDEDVDALLSFLVHCWPQSDDMLKEDTLKGVRAFGGHANKHLGFTLAHPDVVGRFRRAAHVVIHARAQALHMLFHGEVPVWRCFAEAMVEEWNVGRRSRALPVLVAAR